MQPVLSARPARSRTRAAVYLLLRRGNQILLARRLNTGFQDGNYSLVAGHVEEGESITAAALREAREEVGITLAAADLTFVHAMHRASADDLIYYDFFFTLEHWQGEIVNCEPEKCDDLRWFPLDALPVNTVAYVRAVISQFVPAGQSFSEYGWE